MKRGNFIRSLVRRGCYLYRHGKRHDIYANPATGRRAPVPRHSEISERDALGIPAAIGVDATVLTSCADCGEAMTVEVADGRLAAGEGVAHFSVPARDWWPDVAFT